MNKINDCFHSPEYVDKLYLDLADAEEDEDYRTAEEIQEELARIYEENRPESLESLLDAVCVDVPDVPDELAALCMAQAAGVVA